jgi:hypothetical protein
MNTRRGSFRAEIEALEREIAVRRARLVRLLRTIPNSKYAPNWKAAFLYAHS